MLNIHRELYSINHDFIFLIFFFYVSISGEIDGKGIVCKVYGDTVGYFFEMTELLNIKSLEGIRLEVVKDVEILYK